jgi:hypothetical protein
MPPAPCWATCSGSMSEEAPKYFGRSFIQVGGAAQGALAKSRTRSVRAPQIVPSKAPYRGGRSRPPLTGTCSPPAYTRRLLGNAGGVPPASKFVGVRFSQALRAALPIYLVFPITIGFIIYFPKAVLWLPKQVIR